MTVRLSTKLRNNMVGPLGLAGSFAKGVIYIYSGPQPLSADAAAIGTLLGIVTTDGGVFSFGAPANGLNFDPPVDGTVSKAAADVWRFTGLTSGTAGWFRLMGNSVDHLGVDSVFALPRLDGSIGVTGADMNLSNIAVAAGVPSTIDVFQYLLPAQ